MECLPWVWIGILVTPEEDGSLKTSVFRKPTHTDLYLQRHSHHTISSKYSVAGTLYHRARTVCSNPQLLQKEENHLFQALKKCKYPTWAINKAKLKSQNPNKNTTRSNNNQTGQNNSNNKNLHMVSSRSKGASGAMSPWPQFSPFAYENMDQNKTFAPWPQA